MVALESNCCQNLELERRNLLGNFMTDFSDFSIVTCESWVRLKEVLLAHSSVLCN